MYRVSFTGYRPVKLPFFGEDDPLCQELKQRIEKQIQELAVAGAKEFFTGMAQGVDTWCAEAVLDLKKQYDDISLTAIIPCREQPDKWTAAQQQRYRQILDQCKKTICVSETYTKDCMHRRNRALVDICDILIAVYDGQSGGTYYTIEYAKKRHKKTIIIPPL